MKATVRDDIIGLDSYVDAEFKYKKYIEILYECGGYCFLEQFERHWKKDGGKYLAKKMEKAKLLKSDYYSNYKYLRLADNALKYLKYRNDERNFTDVPKNKIAIQKLKKNPSEKVLFTSAMYFELTQFKDIEGNIFLKKNKQIERLRNTFTLDNTPLIQEKEKHLENLKIKLDQYNFSIDKFADMYANAKGIKDILKEIKGTETSKKDQLQNKKNLFKNYDDEIRDIENQLEAMKKITTQVEKNDRIMQYYAIKIKELEKEIKRTKETIKKLKQEQEIKDKDVEEKVQRLIMLRDISKCVCILSKPNGKNRLMFFSVFPNNPKSNYIELVKEAIKIFDNVKIDELYFHLISIKDVTKKVEDIFGKVKNYMKIKHDKVEVITKYDKLTKLKKYSDQVTDKISYIKEDDIATFEKLREKLKSK